VPEIQHRKVELGVHVLQDLGREANVVEDEGVGTPAVEPVGQPARHRLCRRLRAQSVHATGVPGRVPPTDRRGRLLLERDHHLESAETQSLELRECGFERKD
jgi:hypothetical protein